MTTRRWLRAWAVIALALGGCADEPHPAEHRVIVLGFDGLDPRLVSDWMAEGALPNFSRLARRGHFQSLATSNPAQSPVAWSGFATGANPGSHGIYDFLHRDAATYVPDFSISRVREPKTWDLFGYRIPVEDPVIESLRRGMPFWLGLERERSLRATVLRVPVSFPPDPIHRMLSGMGVPDLLGTQGTYTLYTTASAKPGEGGRVVKVRAQGGRIGTHLEGPPDPLDPAAPALSVDLAIQEHGPAGARITLDGNEAVLKAGQWSDWVPLEFSFGPLMSVGGLVRLNLVSPFPDLKLYVSPINLDPRSPAMALSSPPGYAAELAERIGLYHTLGMPEETWSLNARHIPDGTYLEMVEKVLAEREAMFFDALARRDSELLASVFVQTDRISHMFWRGLDESHPLHEQTDPRGREAVRWIYGQADRILGKTMEALSANDRLIVLSDHGFTDYRRSVHLNRWLIEAGYMRLKPGRKESGALFSEVDWRRTQAYAVGLNSLYINRTGREGRGIVAPHEIDALKQEIGSRLEQLIDPASGEQAVLAVYDGAVIYAGDAWADAPDLIVGYAAGYRASWQTALGAAPPPLMEDNRDKWSGDHLVDPSLVPGVLFTSFEPPAKIHSIEQVPDLVRAALVDAER